MSGRFKIVFKGHRNSERLYTLIAENQAAAIFTRSALENTFWLVVSMKPEDEEA